jgi:hypothetical protein
MGDAEQKTSKSKSQSAESLQDNAALKTPPSRPTLVPPPRRPEPTKSQTESPPEKSPAKTTAAKPELHAPSLPPAASGIEAKAQPAAETTTTPEPTAEASIRNQPIAPPSEPMQYRAIGLVRGVYQPEAEDQLNRGKLISDDDCEIDAVLLGRVTSLVKKHIDLATAHLWVVYPRTREGDEDLHLQIVGVWEPETLGLPGESPAQSEGESAAATNSPDDGVGGGRETASEPDADTIASDSATGEESASAASAAPETAPTPTAKSLQDLPDVEDNFFSIRGEVVKYSPEDEEIQVKILQGMKRSPKASKAFRLMLHGSIEGRTVGYFWDFKVKRSAHALVLEQASVVGIVPPKKRSKGGGDRKRMSGRGPTGGRHRPMPARPTGVKGSPRPRKPDASGEA